VLIDQSNTAADALGCDGWEVCMNNHYPVLEVAILDVKRGQVEAFQASFQAAQPFISAAPGFGGLELRRCVENDHRFLLLVRWDSVASHEIGFRGSPGYAEWKKSLHHFYEPFPTVEHYVLDAREGLPTSAETSPS
jgi:heme-degrading monooxygenase HmoA